MAEDFEFDLENKGTQTYAPVNDDRPVVFQDATTAERVNLDFEVGAGEGSSEVEVGE